MAEERSNHQQDDSSPDCDSDECVSVLTCSESSEIRRGVTLLCVLAAILGFYLYAIWNEKEDGIHYPWSQKEEPPKRTFLIWTWPWQDGAKKWPWQ